MLKDFNKSDRQYTIEDLEELLDKLPYQIWLKDKDGKHIYINKLGSEMIGLSKEDIIGKSDYEIRDYNIAKKCDETDKKLIENNDSIYTLQYNTIDRHDICRNVHKFKIQTNKNKDIIMGGISNETNIERNLQLELENNLLRYLDNNRDKCGYKNNLHSIISDLNVVLKSKNIEILLYDENKKSFNLYISENKENSKFKESQEIYIDEETENKLYGNDSSINIYCEIYDAISQFQKHDLKDNIKFKHIKLADKLHSLVCISYDKNIDIISIDDSYLDNVFSKVSIIIKQIENKEQISSIKNQKDELEELIKLESIVTDFFANISHEFRTPVNIILSTVQLLNLFVDEKTNNTNISKEKYVEYLNILKQNSYRLLRLVNNIIDTAKISNNFYELKLGNYNIINVIESITMSTVKYANNKGRNIIFDTDEEEVIIACDPEKIERIILNLISNAIKFSDFNTDIEVKINTNLDKNMVFISVKNYGQPINEEDKERIFGKFTQVDNLFIRENEGSGIGLFLTKKFVEMHNGKIYLDNVEDGTQLTFYLPIYNVDKEYKFNEKTYTDDNVEKCNIEFSDIYL